jgi:DNA-binding NtrC family response regulator
LNGSFIFHSYLERGDVVEIGLNKLHFKNLKTETYQIFSNEMAMGNLPILIEGETGTGKSYLAKKIHEESARTGEFVHLNLSAFAPSLLESELFGHVKGAFTGAVGDKIGAIKAAEAGTLFLDEIDSVSMDIQIKLLLFLESLEYRPVGSIKNVKANVKVIVASGRSLKELVKANQVRRDFYFRLSSGHIIKLQSLRDDENLIKFYMRKYEEENGILISNNLKEFYMKYSWPGNIRQLYSHLNKKRSLTNKCKLDMDQHDESLLEMEMENGDFLASNQVLSLDKIKEIYCTKIYYKTNRDIKNTSELLQISQNTLRKMIKNHAA